MVRAARGGDHRSTLRIDLDDPGAHAELTDILRANGCAVLESAPHTLHVSPPEADYQADVELMFFVRAWAWGRPGIVVAPVCG